MTELPPRWKKSEKSLRAVQLVFEFSKAVSETVRLQANADGLSTSDKIRTIIGLPAKKPKRPRLSVSLSDEDYDILGQRYNIPAENKNAIRKAISEEIVTYANGQKHESQT